MTDTVSLMIHSHLPRLYSVCTQSPLSNLLLHKLWINLLVKFNIQNSSLLAYATMHNNIAVWTQQPTGCHIAGDWKLWPHQYENLQHHNIKFSFKLFSNFSLQFKVTLPAHNSVYKVIQEERSVFWELTVLVIIRKNRSYDHVSNSEWLLRLNRLNLQT